MKAMVLNKPRTPLLWTELPDRQPGSGEIRVKVLACGVCRTDLHVVDGELPSPKSPIIPGHEIVGRIDAIGAGVEGLSLGDRVGIPWLGHTCGVCSFCRLQRENLCDDPLFTGYTRDGGFATAAIADARFAFPLGETGSDVSLAPLLVCRSDRLAFTGHRRRRQKGRALRIRRSRPHHRAGREVAGPIGVWLHAARRPCDTGLCAESRREMGRRIRRDAARAARCCDHLCDGW